MCLLFLFVCLLAFPFSFCVPLYLLAYCLTGLMWASRGDVNCQESLPLVIRRSSSGKSYSKGESAGQDL